MQSSTHFMKEGASALRKLLLSYRLLFQLQSVPESLAHALGDTVIAVGIGIEGDGVYPRYIHLAVHHDAFVGGDIHHLTDDAAAHADVSQETGLVYIRSARCKASSQKRGRAVAE